MINISTKSIFKNVVINSMEDAENLVNAMEKSKKMNQNKSNKKICQCCYEEPVIDDNSLCKGCQEACKEDYFINEQELLNIFEEGES